MSERRELEPVVNPNAQTAREIERRAGQGLTREYWMRVIQTPFGAYSLRSLVYASSAVLGLLIIFAIAIVWRISTPPAPVILPETDALNVMTHVHANFVAPVKDEQFAVFTPDNFILWNHEDAYTFRFVDESGLTQQVIILSFDDVDDLNTDYRSRSAILSRNNEGGAIYFSPELNIEQRGLTGYNPIWKTIRLGNMLMLMSPSLSVADQQQLQSHFISIVGAQQRDNIPTATP